MRALDLINQMIDRTPSKQYSLLRELIEEEMGTPTGIRNEIRHHKKVSSALKREITLSKNKIKSLESELSEILTTIKNLEILLSEKDARNDQQTKEEKCR